MAQSSASALSGSDIFVYGNHDCPPHVPRGRAIQSAPDLRLGAWRSMMSTTTLRNFVSGSCIETLFTPWIRVYFASDGYRAARAQRA